MRRAGRVLCLLLLCAVFAVASIAGWGYSTFTEPGPLQAKTRVIIDRGAGLRAIAATLAEAGVIDYPLLFVAATKYLGRHDDLKAGEYQFAPPVSPAQALATIRAGHVVSRKITIPEGLTSTQVSQIVANADGLTGNLAEVASEGSLLPETYDYAWADTRASLIRRMAAAQANTLATPWRERQENLPLDSPSDALILASIVEKETGISTERPRVAAVFINRLRRGMRLQSDPTIVYALTEGKGPLGRKLRRSDLNIDHPYNTYRIKGLPPGPITNPGAAAIAAVLNPASTKALYFVANGKGGHAFAKTLKEHNRNVARWRRLQRARPKTR